MRHFAETAAKATIAGAFGLMVIAALLQVVSRYVFNSPLGWTEELAKLLMVWWTFLAVGVLAFRGRLLGIDAVIMTLSPVMAHRTMALAQFASAFIIGWLAYLGVRLVGLAGTQITPSLDIPYAVIYASLPIGLGLAALGFLVRGAMHLRASFNAGTAHPIAALDRTDT